MRLHVPIKLRWSDLDAYGHVNNAAMLTLLEESRISVFWHGDLKVDGVGYSTSGGFISDITAKLDDYKAQIVAGTIKVPTEPAA